MTEASIKDMLLQLKNGRLDIEEVVQRLKNLPFEDLGFAKIDHHRGLRRGQPETIFCEGKTIDQIKGIVQKMQVRDVNIMATRAGAEVYEALRENHDNVKYHESARIVVINQVETEKIGGRILIVSAGTSDIPVAEEAAVTAEVMGNRVEKLYDVGVAGIHRLISHLDKINEASVIVTVAGMEGALPSVVGGLTDKLVIAVPTSVGYGASFHGFSALLTMLNSCVSGVVVVNIDNGFGAGYCASLVNRMASKTISAVK